jgi:EAL domain-containing protein (putative c-di-GMP-specific phosphodiesterase class I)
LGAAGTLARLGADRFGATLWDPPDAAHAVHMLDEALFEVVRAPFQVDHQEIRLSVSAGIALYPADARDAETLCANAEAAHKKAKNSGDRYLFYAPEMHARVKDALALEADLHRGLERGEFILYYQPKLDLNTEAIHGLEALIRWNHPTRGLVSPNDFIPLLEETGLIVEVGHMVVKEAVRQQREWLERGLLPGRVAVNVSAIQFRQEDFVATVQNLVAAGGALDLELTETIIMSDIDTTLPKLRELRGLGIGLMVDDFGIGYSSLNYLSKLPLTDLKIDQSFVWKMATSPDDLNIVSTIIHLAHSFRLNVIGEGVETEEQRKLLRLLHCDEIQGFLVSPPLPAAQIESLLPSRDPA